MGSCNHSPGTIELKETINVSVHFDMDIDGPLDTIILREH